MKTTNTVLPHALTSVRGAVKQMQSEGFCHIKANDFMLTEEQRISLKMLRTHFETLPADKYDKNANRYRQLTRYILLPFENMLIPRPYKTITYKQDESFNQEAMGSTRHFELVPDSIVRSKFLRDLIMHDLANSPISNDVLLGPIEVGVHLIRLKATSNHPGIATPNCLHKDGEPITWIHLMNRKEVTGGENIITDNNQKTVLFESTLDSPLDSIGIVDDMVWHMVNPVRVARSAEVGFRDVVLIDFTPMITAPAKPLIKPAEIEIQS